MSSLPDNAPSPRLCIIVKWPDFEGYGFNLHAEKSKPGQYIGKVDSNSPAETAGLREGDRIIEVNGANIANENHKQVVQRIKAVADETRLLVVDAQTDKWYKNKNIVVRGTQENVIVRSSARNQKSSTPEPPSQPAAAVSNGHHDEADNRSVSSAASSSATSEVSTQPQHAATPDEPDKDKDVTVEEASEHQAMEDQKSRSPSPPPAEEAEQPSDEAAVPQEDTASLSSSDRHSDKDVNVAAEDALAEATEKDESHDEEPVEKSEQVPPEADAPVEEEAKEEEKAEEKEESPAEATPPPAAEQESDLEAEYDNVEIDAGRAAVAATQAASDSRRLSASSGDSHSSHGSDTARTTDSHTQSPMSTSPTPPPSLEPAPVPEPVRSSPSPKSSTTTKTTTTTTTNATSNNTNNASPKPASNNNNAYNSSGLNLNMSAAEMRARLASKKKADPRKETVDLKKKYEIIQNM